MYDRTGRYGVLHSLKHRKIDFKANQRKREVVNERRRGWERKVDGKREIVGKGKDRRRSFSNRIQQHSSQANKVCLSVFCLPDLARLSEIATNLLTI